MHSGWGKSTECILSLRVRGVHQPPVVPHSHLQSSLFGDKAVCCCPADISAATTTGCQLNYTGCKHPLLHFHCGFKSFRDQTVGCNLILFSFCVNKFEDGVQINFIDLVCTHKHKLALVSIFSLCVLMYVCMCTYVSSTVVEEVSKIRVKVHNNKW